MKEKTTDELFNGFVSTKDLGGYIRENNDEFMDITLSEYIRAILRRKGLRPATAAQIGGLNESYVHDIVNGRRTNPGRDKLIALAFGMGLDCAETCTLLKIAGCRELYARDKRDGIIIYSLLNSKSVVECDMLLFDEQLDTLSEA